MSSERPLVSVIMPTYQGAAFVGETIESVLAQTYEPIELVVVDDASTDGTPDIVAGYGEKVRLERGQERIGPTRRRNEAIALSQGELIAWLDQDDLWLPDKTARQVEVMLERPEVGLVYTGYEAFDETGKAIPWRDRDSEAEGDVLVPLFVRGCFVGSLTALFRRKVLERRNLRLREKDFSFGDDYYLWLALSLDWQVARIDEVLARYRRHADNESSRIAETNFHLRRVDLLHDFLDEFPEASERLGPWRRRGLAQHYVDAAGYEPSRFRAALDVGRAFVAAPFHTVRLLRGR